MSEPTISIATGEYNFLLISKEPVTITELALYPTSLTIVVRLNGRVRAHNPLADLVLTPYHARALGQALLALAGEKA